MLEALFFAAAVAAAPAAPRKDEPPPLELLEFIGEWSDNEAAALIDPRDKNRKVSRRPPPADADPAQEVDHDR